jgi:signal transduction histidine kinase/ActR/RegA family two-component response regulator
MALEIRTLILVRSEEANAELGRLVERLPWTRGRHLAFGVIHGEVQQAVAAQRERNPNAPIGVLVEDESAVLAALAGGADDATVLTEGYEAAPLAAFVDRVELRAQLRGESQRLQETFAHTERLTALGTLVAGVGHEINNPLSAVMLSIEVARRYFLPALEAAREIAGCVERGEPFPQAALDSLRALADPERDVRGPAAIFEEMATAAEAIASIVRDLRTFARADTDEAPEPVEITELIDHAIRLSGREATRRGVLERDYAPDLPTLLLPRGRVTQVIMNVFVNALHAIAEVERPAHRVRIQVRADEAFVAVAISDTGGGIPPESLERIFAPFFTTKRQSLGTGLGLSISRAILRRLGGELSVESLYGEGATFLCFLPIPSPESLRESWRKAPIVSPSATMLAAGGGTSVLVIDDDERMLRSYARLLGGRHRLMIASDGREAIEMLESGSMPGVLLIDLDVPGLEHRALLDWLATRRPDLARRAIVITAPSSENDDEELLKSYPSVVLSKPLRGDALLAAIDSLKGAA